jgi:hypothetical protein
MRIYFLALAITLAILGCADSIKHDEMLAGKRAIEFAQVVFINHDLDRGYALVADAGKRHVPLDKFKETITRMHPRTFPTSVTATDYEPMPGEKAIYIFLTGQNAAEQFFYRLTLEGTAANDYKVLKLDQGGGMFSAASRKQPFNTSLSTHP